VGLELHLAGEALDDADELAPRPSGRPGADGEEVEHPGPARRGPPRRAEHERAVEVGALGLGARRGRRQGEMAAALIVEQAGEHAAGVEALQAAPVDRAAAMHERCGVAVGDQPVVADARRRLIPAPRDVLGLASAAGATPGALPGRGWRAPPRAPARGPGDWLAASIHRDTIS
jgi:hypothetical protein